MRTVLTYNKTEIFFCPVNNVVWVYINNTYKIIDKGNVLKSYINNIPKRTLVYDLGGGYLD